MANRMFSPLQGCLEAGIVKLFGKVVCAAGGVVSDQLCKGFTVARTGVGTYRLTLEDKYHDLRALALAVMGPGAAFGTTAGLSHFIVDYNVNPAGTTPATIDLQFVDSATGANAELPNVSGFLLELSMKNSSVY